MVLEDATTNVNQYPAVLMAVMTLAKARTYPLPVRCPPPIISLSTPRTIAWQRVLHLCKARLLPGFSQWAWLRRCASAATFMYTCYWPPYVPPIQWRSSWTLYACFLFLSFPFHNMSFVLPNLL